jgi:hypothetical protein
MNTAQQQPVHLTTTQLVNPVNKQEEKEKFFFDVQYNPQFEYLQDIPEHVLHRYSPTSQDLYEKAKSILDTVIKTYGTESAFLLQSEGELLDRSRTEQIITNYLAENNLSKKIMVRFSYELLTRASFYKNVLSIRLPNDFREKNILGMLNHEIGTHGFRYFNELEQPWYGKKEEFGFSPYLETEEGLAGLHYYLTLNLAYLWKESLHYFSIYQGERLSFSELWKVLEPYIDNKERRWTQCLRAKRGFSDTSQPGAYGKDQVYFSGALRVLKWLKENEYAADRLYLGKIDLNDLEKAESISKVESLKLPLFVQDKKEYKNLIQKIIETNNLTK